MDLLVEIATWFYLHDWSQIQIARALELDPSTVSRYLKRAREESLTAAEPLLEAYGIPRSRLHMPTGKVGAAVTGTAKKLKANVLVMGTTARTGLKGLVIGNSAERVLSRAACDILALKP